ncbi:MAG: response regulator [Candidatus Didemnitutus sp.]|nr:response regulator [Candidatus Didemnitutus sp.]
MSGCGDLLPHRLVSFCLRRCPWLVAVWSALALTAGAAAAETDEWSELGYPVAQVYRASDYDADPQNWCVTQDRQGRLYFGNRSSVVVRDGNRWHSIEVEEALFIQGITCDREDRVWLGGVNAVGYLEHDGFGGRRYVSLTAQVPAQDRPFGYTRAVHALSHGVYFDTDQNLLRWHNGKFSVERTLPDTKVCAAGDLLFATSPGEPVRAFDGKAWQVAADTPALRAGLLLAALPREEGGWIFVTDTQGLWHVRANGAPPERFAADAEPLRGAGSIATALAQGDGRLVVSLFGGGLVFLERDGRLIYHLAVEPDGRPWRDTSTGLLCDAFDNLWVARVNGIVRLAGFPRVSRFGAPNGLPEMAVRAPVRYAGRIHLPGDRGVFRLEPAGADGTPAKFETRLKTRGPVWELAEAGGSLLAAASDGLHVIGPDGFEYTLTPPNGTRCWSVLASGVDPRIAFVGCGRELRVVQREGERWRWTEIVLPTPGDLRGLAAAADGSVWGAAQNVGYLRFLGLPGTTQAGKTELRAESYFGGHGLPSETLPLMRLPFSLGGDAALYDQGRLYRFDPTARRFNEFLAPRPPSGTKVFSLHVQDERVWVYGEPDSSAGRKAWPLWRHTPPDRWDPMPASLVSLVGQRWKYFEETGPGSRDLLWFAGTDALVRMEFPLESGPAAPFRAVIRRVEQAGRPMRLAADEPVQIEPGASALVFNFGTNRLDDAPLLYQTRLASDAEWSAPAPENSLVLRRPPTGRQTLLVRARDADFRWSEPAEFNFLVLPPWWQTWWALTGFAFAGVVAMTGAVRWRMRAAHRRNLELERQVAARTGELREREQQLVVARDAAEAANRAKSVFLASMSHELRTPLNAILGYAQLLRHAPGLDGDVRRQIETMHASGDHLLHLINDVLDLAKIEAGKAELQLQPMSLACLLAHVTEVFAPRAAQKGIAFSVRDETRLSDALLADEARLRQVLFNLVGNALKFTERGSVALSVEAVGPEAASAGDGVRRLRFTVRDTGIGIAASEQAAIFDLFHQAAGPHLSAEGVGLGLAISQRLVRLMGGVILVESTPGEGSRFWFDLPLAEAPAGMVQTREILPTRYRGPRRRVLVVDDKVVNREVLRALLEPCGLEVEEADDGASAVARVAARLPDLVLMDLRLTGVDGLTATRRIRALPGGAGVRIVAISASVFPVDRTLALEAGCDDFEPKPIVATRLLATIGRLLAIEWEYAAPVLSEGPAPGTLPSDWLLPSRTELEQLDALAELGDLRALRAQLAAMRQGGNETALFLDALDSLAAQAQLARLRAWIVAALRRTPGGNESVANSFHS